MRLYHVLLWLDIFFLVSSYNILFMAPFPGLSHWLWSSRFVDELLKRGHHLTVVTGITKPSGPHPNYTEILMDPVYDFEKSFSKKAIFEMNFKNDFDGINLYWNIGLETAEFALNDKKVKQLIERKDQPFDCFIMEQFFSESFLMFGHKFKIPTITLSTLPNSHHLDHLMGLVAPWSESPHFLLPYNDEMNFKERTHNTILTIFDLFYRNTFYLPRMQTMVEKHFANHTDGPIPSITDLEKQVSLILVNSHRATDSPRPTISGLVNIGGAHIQKPKPLPEHIKKFIDSAEHGVIYFSLGSNIKSKELPKDKLNEIVRGFGQLKQKVLMKYEDESLTNLPKNIMTAKWMPQSDILAHRKVVLFINHGGRFGALEATYWGKPMLSIPFYGDQHANVQKLKNQKIALSLDFLNFTAEELVTKVNILLTKPYSDRSKEISAIFQDNLVHPMEEAMYWIEYVIRHKGASHLKSKAINLNIFEHLLLDVLLIHFAFLIFALYFMYSLIQPAVAFILRLTGLKKKRD